jgi:hypothetical protein
MGTHLFHCSHGGEQITSHNTFRDAFAFIMKDVRFHVLHEQIHVLPLPSFESFHWWVNTMLSIDCIRTLIDVVIVDPTWAHLILWVASFDKAPWSILSLSISLDYIWFCELFCFTRWPWQWWFMQNDFTMINIQHMHFSFLL